VITFLLKTIDTGYNKTMNFLLFIPYYIRWHYSKALGDILELWKNTFSFVERVFSMKLLTYTLFAPWKRMGESYKGGFDPGGFFSTLVFNILMRGLGFVARAAILLLGLFFLVVAFFAGAFLFIIWVSMPFILFSMFLTALHEMI